MIALDIETIPNENLISALPEPEIALGNTKDPEKIAAKIAEAKKNQVAKMALDPFFGRVCSFATWGADMVQCGFETVDEDTDSAEIALLNKLLPLFCMEAIAHPRIITWQGNKFDIPFIFTRAMLLRVEVPQGCLGVSQLTKKYQVFPHCDLAQVLTNWGQSYISLDCASRLILGEGKQPMDVTKFLELIKTGRSQEIGVYNLKDAELTYRIYERSSQYFW